MTEDALTPDEISEPVIVEDDDTQPPVSEPTKLIRIASMTRAMLEEVRQAPLDLESRRRLLDVHRASISELREVLNDELKEELDEIFRPFDAEHTPTEGELRIAHAQLIGWLEGLFHGIQASIMTQQMMMQTQLAEMTRRQQLEPGQDEQKKYPGVYL
ncbi:MAG: DUF2587 domain-containing protein [Acidimicrobiia bacterium]|nr:DUF2587 domain-containing protein [Acidimicrobiia bacterium]